MATTRRDSASALDRPERARAGWCRWHPTRKPLEGDGETRPMKLGERRGFSVIWAASLQRCGVARPPSAHVAKWNDDDSVRGETSLEGRSAREGVSKENIIAQGEGVLELFASASARERHCPTGTREGREKPTVFRSRSGSLTRGGLGPGRRDVRPGRVPSPFTTESAHVRRRGERYGVLHKRDALIQRRRQTRRSQTRMMSCRRRVPLEPGDIRFVPPAQGRGRDLG